MAQIAPLCLFLASAVFLVPCAWASPVRTQSELLWLQQIEDQAVQSGISPDVVYGALDNFVPNPRIVELDQKQPESTISFEAYRRIAVTPGRIKKGAEALRLYGKELEAIEVRTGVPPQMVIALWGVESSFGQKSGDFEVVNALATLAYEGRRAAYFRTELFSALRILERENMSPEELRGSWAGAMGQSQFMPSIYLKFAVDEDGDGQRDIWNDSSDVLASIANYLAAEGWRRDLTWGREVESNGISADEVGLAISLPLREWAKKGVTAVGGSPLPQRALQASFIQPDGEDGSGFLVYDNFRALMRWNHSTYFALSVGLLADRIEAE